MKAKKELYDYVIVGAGTSGGILSHNLAAAGADVLLLEAGQKFNKDTYPNNEADASAQLYWGGGIEFSKDARMAFLRGKVVGGGSVINQALMDRFDDVAFNDWKDESGVDFFTTEAYGAILRQSGKYDRTAYFCCRGKNPERAVVCERVRNDGLQMALPEKSAKQLQ